MGLCKLIKDKINNYQTNIRVNLFGENDGFKMFGSTPSIIVFMIAVMVIGGYVAYLFNKMFTL